MIAEKQELIRKELEEGTGATISVTTTRSGLRTAMRIWFGDLDEKHGPVAELKPYGLRGHRVELVFGRFSGEILAQISNASQEDVQLARALVTSIHKDAEVDISDQNPNEWCITSGAFKMTATVRNRECPSEDAALIAICRDVIVPMMAAMAELIGYDVVEEEINDHTPAFEGAILRSVVQRRERNPRNRLLCIRIHGEKCTVCGIDPKRVYKEAGTFIEVHHLEPVALLSTPRAYDPNTDLVPLCPNCHRAVHTRRPIPIGVDELRSLMGLNCD